jgi:hypothetical protein
LDDATFSNESCETAGSVGSAAEAEEKQFVERLVIPDNKFVSIHDVVVNAFAGSAVKHPRDEVAFSAYALIIVFDLQDLSILVANEVEDFLDVGVYVNVVVDGVGFVPGAVATGDDAFHGLYFTAGFLILDSRGSQYSSLL